MDSEACRDRVAPVSFSEPCFFLIWKQFIIVLAPDVGMPSIIRGGVLYEVAEGGLGFF